MMSITVSQFYLLTRNQEPHLKDIPPRIGNVEVKPYEYVFVLFKASYRKILVIT